MNGAYVIVMSNDEDVDIKISKLVCERLASGLKRAELWMGLLITIGRYRREMSSGSWTRGSFVPVRAMRAKGGQLGRG